MITKLESNQQGEKGAIEHPEVRELGVRDALMEATAGNYEKAEEILMEARKSRPDDFLIDYTLGEVYKSWADKPGLPKDTILEKLRQSNNAFDEAGRKLSIKAPRIDGEEERFRVLMNTQVADNNRRIAENSGIR